METDAIQVKCDRRLQIGFPSVLDVMLCLGVRLAGSLGVWCWGDRASTFFIEIGCHGVAHLNH